MSTTHSVRATIIEYLAAYGETSPNTIYAYCMNQCNASSDAMLDSVIRTVLADLLQFEEIIVTGDREFAIPTRRTARNLALRKQFLSLEDRS